MSKSASDNVTITTLPDETDLESSEVYVQATETVRLLGDEAHIPNLGQIRKFPYLTLKIYIIIATVNMAFQILIPTQIVLFESIYCQKWYDEHGLPSQSSTAPEQLCKIPPVQEAVSDLRGYNEFFAGFPSLLVAIPLGIALDIFGRKKFFIINISTMFLQQCWIALVIYFSDRVDLRWVWLQTSFNFISGGELLAEMMFSCILADITPREKFAVVTFRLLALGQVCRIIGPIIAGLTLRWNPWSALLSGLAMFSVTVLIVTTIPETFPKPAAVDLDQYTKTSSSVSRWGKILGQTKRSIGEFGVIWTNWRLIAMLFIYPFRKITNAISDLMIRYVSNRYQWALADATFLNSIQACAAAFMLFAVLPYLSHIYQKRYPNSVTRENVTFIRSSLFVLAVSYLIEGLAPTSAIFLSGLILETMAGGLSANLRAVVVSIIEPRDNGRVFSVFAISETLSNMIVFPVTAKLFNIGLEKGNGPWLGLPFDVAALASLVGLAAMCFLKLDRK